MTSGQLPPTQPGSQPPQPPPPPPPSQQQQQPQTVVQATGALANEIIGGLKAQPIMLGVLVLNAMFLFLLWYMVDNSGLRRHEEIKLLLDRCFENARQDAEQSPNPNTRNP